MRAAHNWEKLVQDVVSELDESIRQKDSGAASLSRICGRLGFSATYFSKRFREASGMRFREYLAQRRLALALREVRDTDKGFLEIALDYGFSSTEAFSRSFKKSYGVSPREFRASPVPVRLRTTLRPWDRWLSASGCFALDGQESAGKVQAYFVTVPAHKFLHVKNYESVGYYDFWERQSRIPGQDCETICGLLDSIKGKLDDSGGLGNDSGSGQIMAWQNSSQGRICSWGIPLAECYGVRLPVDYAGSVPPAMILEDVPEGEYIVFEHGPFDFARENRLVESRIEAAMKDFDYAQAGYELDLAPGRFFYFYHDCKRFWKYVRPVRRLGK